MKTYFISGDVHGHYSEWRKALTRAGFRMNNPNHVVVHIGDLFDRGQEAVACYQFARRLEKKGMGIFLKGNHTDFFIQFLEKRDSLFNFTNNGCQATIDDFDHCTDSFQMWCIENKPNSEITSDDYYQWAYKTADSINKEYPELLEWLKTRPYYFETKNNIFTHGCIDTRTADWHQPTMYYRNMTGWKACTWVGPDYFRGWWNNTHKACNFGHLHADLLRQYLHKDIENIGRNDMFYWKEENTYFLDTCTVLTHRVNVRVIEDEEVS